MKTVFWGVRGSIITSSASNSIYGGNTTCIETELDNGCRIIFDAGTGLRELGLALTSDNMTQAQAFLASQIVTINSHNRDASNSTNIVKKCAICLSHGHWDHVIGLPFFAPLYDPSWEVRIYGPSQLGGVPLEDLMQYIFSPTVFPVVWTSLPSQPQLFPLVPNQTYDIYGATLTTYNARHCEGALSYVLEADDASLLYTGDFELGLQLPLDDPVVQALADVDIAVVDAQYSYADYLHKQGWGHSSMEQWPPLANKVKYLVLTHFDPTYTDTYLNDCIASLRRNFPQRADNIYLAHEGLKLTVHRALNSYDFDFPTPDTCYNCSFLQKLYEYSDISLIFETLLSEARAQTHADAGTIYLRENNKLHFSYSQNDTLFTASQAARLQYLKSSISIDKTSIAGFVALHNVTLNIEDVYALPPDLPYTFNPAFDQRNAYRTKSVCALPLCNLQGEVVGVLQVINCMHNRKIVSFSPDTVRKLKILGKMGTQAMIRAQMVQDMILRMLQTAALRDPTETASHVLRVGAMAAEIYHRWAESKQISLETIFKKKALIRLAAMLHDIGKVGISDLILKKAGPLSPEERKEMETHCFLGASLFNSSSWELDKMSKDIALHHHQKWDGTGYTGSPDVPILQGRAIPLGARLTAIADVYDALISKRCYKDAWPEEKALRLIQSEAGHHFDPELVEAFMSILQTIRAIQSNYEG